MTGMWLEIEGFTDSKCVLDVTNTTHYMLPRDRSLVLPVRHLRQIVQDEHIDLKYVQSSVNLADALTKPLV